MGQLSCSKPENDPDFQRFSLVVSKGEFHSMDDLKEGSLIDKYLLGKNMKIGKNTMLETIWKEKLNTFQKLVDRNENDTATYQNSLTQRWSLTIDSNLSSTDKLMLLFSQLEKMEFRRYGLNGLPQEYRWSYWKTITSQGEKEKNGTADNDSSYCINKDINRTLISDAFKDEEVVRKLDGVLNAIAYRFPKVGYCQGMNYIAALLLMVSGANQNETIQVFSHMLKSSFYMLNLMFQNDLPLLFVLEQIILSVISTRLPKLSKHLINNEIPTSFWLSKMLLSGFVYLFSVRDCVLFWDYILIKGTVKGFTGLILAMMQLYQSELLQMDQSQIAEFFSFQESKKDAQEIIRVALSNKDIEGKEIRKIMSKNNTPIGQLFQKFEEPDFDDNYKKFSKQ